MGFFDKKSLVLKKDELLAEKESRALATSSNISLSSIKEKVDGSLNQYSGEEIGLVLIIDQSFSMEGTERDIMNGIEDLFREHRRDPIRVTLIGFGNDVKSYYFNRSIRILHAPELEMHGNTNLNGAVYKAVNDNIFNKARNHMLYVVISDGQNNIYEFSNNDVKRMVESVSPEYNHFYFIGEGDERTVYETALSLGFKSKNIAMFTRNNAGNRLNLQVVSQMLSELLKKGKISEDWSQPIKENYLRLTDGRGR